MTRRLVLLAGCGLAAAGTLALGMRAVAQGLPKVTASAALSPEKIAPGGKGTLTVTLVVPAGYHVHETHPKDEFAIGTTFKAREAAGVTLGDPVFPKPVQFTGTDGKPAFGYTGSTKITIPVTVAKTAKAGEIKVGGSVRAQACNDQSCLPPDTLPVTATLTVAP